jgi:HEAT repeat protein
LFSQDIHTEIFAEGFRDKIFDTETIAALGRALGDEFLVRSSAVDILHCCHSSRCAPLFSQDIHTEIFAEGFRDKIFDTETVAALVHALGDEDSNVRSSAVNSSLLP